MKVSIMVDEEGKPIEVFVNGKKQEFTIWGEIGYIKRGGE